MGADSKITSKGQITIPLEIRRKLQVSTGDRIRFREDADGRIVVERLPRSALELAGILHNPDRKPLTLEEMRAFPDAALERYERSFDDRD